MFLKNVSSAVYANVLVFLFVPIVHMLTLSPLCCFISFFYYFYDNLCEYIPLEYALIYPQLIN